MLVLSCFICLQEEESLLNSISSTFVLLFQCLVCVLKLILTFQGRHCLMTASWVNSEYDLK